MKTCPRCQAENPADARFCMSCAAPLVLACPQCGAELPSDARFCSNCGHQLAVAALAPRSASAGAAPARDRLQQYIPKELLARLERASADRQGERRIVTTLFCDVVASTAAAERLDPEDWAEVMNGAFERLIGPVYRYEGTL